MTHQHNNDKLRSRSAIYNGTGSEGRNSQNNCHNVHSKGKKLVHFITLALKMSTPESILPTKIGFTEHGTECRFSRRSIFSIIDSRAEETKEEVKPDRPTRALAQKITQPDLPQQTTKEHLFKKQHKTRGEPSILHTAARMPHDEPQTSDPKRHARSIIGLRPTPQTKQNENLRARTRRKSRGNPAKRHEGRSRAKMRNEHSKTRDLHTPTNQKQRKPGETSRTRAARETEPAGQGRGNAAPAAATAAGGGKGGELVKP